MADGPAAGAVLRWVRALVLASVALLTGVVLHAMAGGLLPDLGVLLGLVAVSTAGVAPLLGREASTARVVCLVVGWQTGIHVALTALAGHRGDSLTADGGTAAPAGQHTDSAAADWLQHLVADLTGPNAVMAVAHLAAAAAVGWWLAAGERALWGLLALATRPVVAASSALLSYLGCRLVADSAGELCIGVSGRVRYEAKPLGTPLLCRVLPRRGPPC